MKVLQETQVADYVATTNSGSVQVIHQLDKNQKDKVKGTEAVADLEEVPGTSKTLNEVNIENQDSIAVAKQVGKALAEVLRDHGDQIQTMNAKNCNTEGCTIVVNYGKPGDEVGANSNNPELQNNDMEQDEFEFKYKDGVLYLSTGDSDTEICPIQNQSGTVKIQSAVAQENLKRFIEEKTPSELGDSSEAEPEEPVEISEEARGCFAEAVQNYRKDKNKESVKGLFRAARNFKGNTIQEKLKEAVEDYKASIAQQITPEVPTSLPCPEPDECPEELPVEQPSGSVARIQTNISFLLRLMEFVKDEVHDDDQLHQIAQRIEDRGTVTMDDFIDVVGETGKCEEPEQDPEEEVDEYYDEDGRFVDGRGIEPEPKRWERDGYDD